MDNPHSNLTNKSIRILSQFTRRGQSRTATILNWNSNNLPYNTNTNTTWIILTTDYYLIHSLSSKNIYSSIGCSFSNRTLPAPTRQPIGNTKFKCPSVTLSVPVLPNDSKQNKARSHHSHQSVEYLHTGYITNWIKKSLAFSANLITR